MLVRPEAVLQPLGADGVEKSVEAAEEDPEPSDEVLEREEVEIEGELYVIEKRRYFTTEGSMKQARANVGASTCWKGYKAKGTNMPMRSTSQKAGKQYRRPNKHCGLNSAK